MRRAGPSTVAALARIGCALAVLSGCTGEDEVAGRAAPARDGSVDGSAAGQRGRRGEQERSPRGEDDIGGAFGPEVHLLITDIAAHLLCDRIDGAFMSLGTEEGEPASGHLWVRDCVARREGERLAIELDTRAWRWVDRETRQLGATFALAQYVTVDARIELEGVLDVAYNRERRIVRAWLSPSRAPDVSTTVIGDLDVDAEGLWSEIVGGIASILGASPSERAGEEAEEETTGELEERLDEGISIAMSLCTRAEHVGLGKPEEGALPRPPVPVESATYVLAQLVELHPGGLAAVGPFRTVRSGVELEVRVTLEIVAESRRERESLVDGCDQEEPPAR